MSIPENVKIGALDYAVTIVPDSASALSPNNAAAVYNDERTITILQAHPQQMRISLLHECIHAMLYSLGYTNHNEQLVDGLANQLYALIVNNPEMFSQKQPETESRL